MTLTAPITLIAHRGASHRQPENTLLAFESALDDRADGLECDVRLTSDGEPVIFHDADLERLTGTPGAIAARTWSDLASLQVSGPAGQGGSPPATPTAPIPHLRDLVDLITRLPPTRRPRFINIELKPLTNHAPLVAACRPHLAAIAALATSHASAVPDAPSLVISSFDPRVLAAFALAPLAHPHRIALIFDDPNALGALRFLPTATYDLHPQASLLTAATVLAWSASGRCFRAWTVDDPQTARRLIALDPTIALITNRPGPLRSELEEAE